MSERKLYSVRLLESTLGSRRRILVIRGGQVRFNLSQKDQAAVDFPAKYLMLDDEEVQGIKALADFEIRVSRKDVAEPRKPSPESLKATTRPIGATKPAADTPKET